MGAADQKHGLAWAKGLKPNPGPTWCSKPRPCDYDKGSSYCPHRECRQKLEAELASLKETLRWLGEGYDDKSPTSPV